MDEHGADALRWFMAASGSPWQPRRIGHGVLQEVVRKTLLTYWNTGSFLTLYAGANDWSPATGPWPDVAQRPALDRWALSEAHRLVREVTEAYETFDSQRVGRLLSAYVDDLSNWYVRRSRRRFWDGDPAALATLHECLYLLTLLMAPVVPFVTERIWQDVVRPWGPRVPESVHLAPWPTVDGSLVDEELARQMALVRAGRRARPVGSGRLQGPQPSAARAGAGRGRRLGRTAGRAAPPGRRRAQRARLRGAGRRAGRPQRQGQLPDPGQAVRQGHREGRRRGGGPPGRRPGGHAARAAAR